jgi:hypothetical protein
VISSTFIIPYRKTGENVPEAGRGLSAQVLQRFSRFCQDEFMRRAVTGSITNPWVELRSNDAILAQ